MQTATVTVVTLLLAAATVSLANHHHESHEGSQPVVGHTVQVDSVSSPVAAQPVDSPVVQPSHFGHHQLVGQQQHHSAPSYYAPAGVIQVVASEQASGSNKPLVGSIQRNQQFASAEQYGQPEAGSLPANYKPFGSWGLYIGGNPADGYYTNYYKALSNSVQDKPAPQVGASPEPKPVSALSPILRQAGSSPYVGADYYPFAYSTSELNTGVAPSSHVIPSAAPAHYATGSSQFVSPVQAGAQVYGTPSSFEPAVFAYADSYATKRVGQAIVQQPQGGLKEPQIVHQREIPVQVVQQPHVQQQQVKGHLHQYAAGYPSQYSSPVVYASAPVAGHQQQQSHVVAYPVPVGSQIVGSQQGIDGAFQPYGVHAFTRYAVKPTAVHSDQSYYYQFPSYKQFGASSTHSVAPSHQAVHQPLSYYGYPLSQLHYSHGFGSPVSSSVSSGSAPGSPGSIVSGVNSQQGVVVESSPASQVGAEVAPVVAEASEEKPQKKPVN